MKLNSTFWRIGALLGSLWLSGCKAPNANPFPPPLPIHTNSNLFHLVGDVVNEQGNPIDGTVGVEEGDIVSITSERYFGNRAVPLSHGKFEVWAGPSDMVALGFGGPGFQNQEISFGSGGNLPPPWLHVVLRKYVAPVPIKLDPFGTFEINVADLHWTGSPWSTLMLNINADGTATTITTFTDHKTVDGKGAWIFPLANRKDVITITIKQQDGAPDPEHISGQPIELDLSSDNNKLIQHRGGPAFMRVK